MEGWMLSLKQVLENEREILENDISRWESHFKEILYEIFN